VQHESDELRVEHFRLHVDRWRGGDAGHVLLLHGLGGNSITWHGVAPELAQTLRARVVAIDYPGFGASRPGSAALSLRVLARVTRAVMVAEAPGARWVLCGNSLGGLLALEVACRFPEQVAAVSLAALALPLAWGRPGRGLRDVLQYVAVATPWQGRRLVTRYVTTRGVPGIVDDPVKLLFADPTPGRGAAPAPDRRVQLPAHLGRRRRTGVRAGDAQPGPAADLARARRPLDPARTLPGAVHPRHARSAVPGERLAAPAARAARLEPRADAWHRPRPAAGGAPRVHGRARALARGALASCGQMSARALAGGEVHLNGSTTRCLPGRVAHCTACQRQEGHGIHGNAHVQRSRRERPVRQ
jgi:pimeloyl-ACP methyl ester carboxylesterase